MVFKADLNAKVYNKYSNLQKKYSYMILNRVKFSGDESILDIGCGDGVITKDLLNFVPNGKVVGIDQSKKMIQLSVKIAKNIKKISFFCMKAENLEFKEKFDKVFSFSCFHWIKNKKVVMQKISKHLKPRGNCFILTYLYSDSFVEPIRDALKDKKYAPLNVNIKNLEQFSSVGEYEAIGIKAGLKLTEYSLVPKIVKFSDLESYANHFKGFHPITKMIPRQKIDDFFTAVSKKALKYSPFNNDGALHCLLPTIILRFERNDF